MMVEHEGTIERSPYTLRKLDQFDLDRIGSPVGGSAVDWQASLEPGDIIFFRWHMDWWNVISRTVTLVDGFFSHVGLYVGDGIVVDSGLSGVTKWELTDIAREFGAHSCLIAARPARPEDDRHAAAAWARGVARPPNDPTAIVFDAEALAATFVVLSKLRLRTALRQTPKTAISADDESLQRIGDVVTTAVKAMEDQRETFDDPFEGQPFPPAVCSGFVWQAYMRNSEALRPALLEGSRIVQGEIFGPPDVDPSVLDLILDETPGDMFGVRSGLKNAFKELAPYLRQAKTIAPTLIGTTLGNRRGTLLELIAPGDLFSSPDMAQRWFLSEEHRTTAFAWSDEWTADQLALTEGEAP